MRKNIILLIILFLILYTTASAGTFKAGAAKVIITPDPLLPVSGGVGVPNAATEKKGDLWIRALVLEKEERRVAVIGIDNLGWPAAVADKARKLITRIPPENILIGATHTHSAPDAYGFINEDGKTGVDLKYLDWCTRQLAKVVNQAVDNLEPAALKIAVGEARGKIAYNYYAEELYDPRCGVIQAIATSGVNKNKTIATLINYAVHPEVIGSDQGILSPDLCGPLYDRVELKTGGVAIFMNGALGGMVTADNRKDNGGENKGWDECVRIGELLADQALEIAANSQMQNNPGLYCISKIIQLPIDSDMMRTILLNSPLNYDVNNEFMATTRLNLLNIGTAQILTIPGEALPNIGYFLKRKMKGQHQFLFGLTNDAFGYIMTKVDFNSFKRYEYISRTSLGEMTGEIFIENALQMIKSNPTPDNRINLNK
jgi:hypothetical protein